MKLLYLEVRDHAQSGGWKTISRINLKPAIIKVIGWLVKEDKDVLILTQGIGEHDDDYVLGFASVIKSTIVKRRELKNVST
jgi:hypothetical protein